MFKHIIKQDFSTAYEVLNKREQIRPWYKVVCIGLPCSFLQFDWRTHESNLKTLNASKVIFKFYIVVLHSFIIQSMWNYLMKTSIYLVVNY